MTEKELRQSEHNKSDSSELFAEFTDKKNEEIRSRLDQAEQAHYERQSEKDALSNATELAEKAANESQHQDETSPLPHERRHGAPSKKQLKTSFDSEIKNVRADMGPASKLFSKLIHYQPIEKTTEVVAATIARPKAMLSGSVAAFITITVLFFFAHHYGYQLSGFETIAAFIVGWILGLLYDYLSTILRK